jgi:nicotinate phosphoribosyltransferase
MTAPAATVHHQDRGLFTDLYELTMAQAFYQQEMFAPATFSLFIRSYPPNRAYFVAAGLEDVLDYLECLKFGTDSLEYLRSTGMFTEEFLNYLAGLRFTGSVRAIPEGRLFFANEPVLEVTAPIMEAQIAETFILNQVNFQTLLTTKASRCAQAAQGRLLADFASRRTHGTDAALKMGRCSYIGGFQSTSNVLAAQRYGIPPSGTMAHSFVSSFPTEKESFRAYARSFPDRSILLLDTYDTIKGAWNAVDIAREMESMDHRLVAVRLDSGDFADLSRRVRRILDDAGLNYVKVLASGGLDEYEIEELVQGGPPIDMFGVGTKAGVSADAPSTDMAYKLVDYDHRPVMKLSEGKAYLPGGKQVFRSRDYKGDFSGDVIGQSQEDLAGAEPLLRTVMTGGRLTALSPTLKEIRETLEEELSHLSDQYKLLRNPSRYPVKASDNLQRLAAQVEQEIASAEDFSGA